MLLPPPQMGRCSIRAGTEVQGVMLREIIRGPRPPATLEVAGSRRKEPSDLAEAPTRRRSSRRSSTGATAHADRLQYGILTDPIVYYYPDCLVYTMNP